MDVEQHWLCDKVIKQREWATKRNGRK